MGIASALDIEGVVALDNAIALLKSERGPCGVVCQLGSEPQIVG